MVVLQLHLGARSYTPISANSHPSLDGDGLKWVAVARGQSWIEPLESSSYDPRLWMVFDIRVCRKKKII